MKIVRDLFFPGVEYLKKLGIEVPKKSMEVLLMHHLGLSRIELFMEFDKPLTESEVEKIRRDLKRRAKGEPLAYIEGRADFLGCQLRLTPDVLIPRPETEWIAEKLIAQLKPNEVVWDVGTGSGAIAIAIKKQIPSLHVYASDMSEKALELARQNATLNGVEITFLQGDLLKPFEGRADYIIANLPYIGTKESLCKEVSDFEPHSALFSGEDGLDHYRRLSEQYDGKAHLWLEIGRDQAPAITKLFGNGVITQDYSGHDRLFSLEKGALKEVL